MTIKLGLGIWGKTKENAEERRGNQVLTSSGVEGQAGK